MSSKAADAALEKVNTAHFSDVELAAKSLAEDVREIKAKILEANETVMWTWEGEGADAYDDFSFVVGQLIKDVSDEFWDVYEALVNAEGIFLGEDQSLATDIASSNVTDWTKK